MKKRAMILQAALLLAVTLTALTAATFAWFTANSLPKTDAFAVQVNGSVPLELAFYRNYGDGNGYVSVRPSQTAPFVNNELLIPGEGLLCRVDVINLGTRSAAVSLSLTELAFTYESAFSVTAAEALKVMQSDLTVLYGVVFLTPQNTDPAEPDADSLTQSRFLDFLSAEGVSATARLVPAFTLEPTFTARIYFRYFLSSDFNGLNGVFSLNATGMAITS